MPAEQAKIFVLVPGAFHGGWCYRRVADLLRARNHRVFTPTLSGLAERSRERNLAINLTTHIDDILDLFTWEELEDVVLCGHSYGGMVVGGVADVMPHRIRHLVYLDAVIPENGKAAVDYIFAEHGLAELVGAAGEANGLFQPVVANPGVLFNVNEADRAMVDRLCTPQPIGTILEKIRLKKSQAELPKSTYIKAANWDHPVTTAARERAAALPGWTIHEIEAGHDIMLDAPAALADLLCTLD